MICSHVVVGVGSSDVFGVVLVVVGVGTRFKPSLKNWNGKSRRCNATYLSKHEGRRLSKLNYFLVSNKWQSSVISSETKWGA